MMIHKVYNPVYFMFFIAGYMACCCSSQAAASEQLLHQRADAAENSARLEASKREVLEAEKLRLMQDTMLQWQQNKS